MTCEAELLESLKHAKERAQAATAPRQPASAPVKFLTERAAGICDRFALGEQAALALSNEMTALRFLEVLAEKQLFPDGVRVLAHGLPKRDAVWWACLCLREALGGSPSAKVKPALEAAEKWAKSPSEENRRDAKMAGEIAGYGTPAGLAALAAFWSGGSMASADKPVLAPADHMTAEAVAGAVLVAAAGAAPDDVPKRQQRFLALGLALASGL
ncbi:MAG: hypothetical protein HY040_22715 [Planctomycetes bacterium]|nr:hypothetical protein [Planctomycetota bacterium]